MSDQPSRRRPNVLLICTDHWSGLLLGAAGHPAVMTPTLDQLARCGVRFSNAYSACPSCIPARRSLMTGMSPRASGLRSYRDGVDYPDVPTLAECFHHAGYQTYAVGKLHAHPQRNRIGFDEVLLDDQGRHQFRDIPDGVADDYELFLAEQGYGGCEYAAGMPHNDFIARPWPLPESCHPVNWAVREMCKAIRRRDPRKPGFWYLSFSAPHPPLTPPQAYLDMYRDEPLPPPATGNWSRRFDDLPYCVKERSNRDILAACRASARQADLARRAFYAVLTHVDHQIRLVIGSLREAGLLDNTVIAFTSDHGHMAGEHGLWCMTPFYEMSAKIPLIVVPAEGDPRLTAGTVDDRIAEYADLYPTLLDLAGIEIPAHTDRLSLVSGTRRPFLYGEHGEGKAAMRMIRAGAYKLLYYPVGNRFQLFDIEADPQETTDLAADPKHGSQLARLKGLLVENLYGPDLEWLREGQFAGLPAEDYVPRPDRSLRGQRGLRFL